MIFHVTRNSMFFCLISDIRDRPHNFGGGCYDFSKGRTQIFTRDKSRNFMLKTTGSYLFGGIFMAIYFSVTFSNRNVYYFTRQTPSQKTNKKTNKKQVKPNKHKQKNIAPTPPKVKWSSPYYKFIIFRINISVYIPYNI